ncbi:hypothetical protein WGT02_30830 (plasmid) [Rhizobium sp. T1470]|nr:hypothetical protein [Rhizobium sp. T1473]MCA0806018.1 hypothetical protein [Rhizobium sp. T1473]
MLASVIGAHVLINVDVLARRLDISVNLVAKLIVIREIMHVSTRIFM